jgi:hypothetical protein
VKCASNTLEHRKKRPHSKGVVFLFKMILMKKARLSRLVKSNNILCRCKINLSGHITNVAYGSNYQGRFLMYCCFERAIVSPKPYRFRAHIS